MAARGLDSAPGLSVCFDMAPFVAAIRTRSVAHLVLASEAKTVVAPEAGKGGVGCIEVGGVEFPACDLGAVIGVPSTRVAWIILEIDVDGRRQRFALGTGACIAVRPIPYAERLPATVFKDRAGLVEATFPAGDIVKDGRTVGLLLDPSAIASARSVTQSSARRPSGA